VIPYIKHQFALGALSLGWVVAIFELGCMLGAFFIARYADKYGRKRTMLWNASLLVISSLGIPLSANATILTRLLQSGRCLKLNSAGMLGFSWT
jgi:MFS family permease